MKRSLFLILICGGVVFATGCSTVTIQPKSTLRKTSSPDIMDKQHFFLWGLAPGSRSVDVVGACGGKTPSQMQARDTFFDRIISFFTLGLYTPRTVKVWCS